MKQTLNSLAGFKKIIQSAMVNGIYIKTSIHNAKGEMVRENDFAPVSICQSNCFALKRNGNDSFIEFGKAERWTFLTDTGKAKKRFDDGYMIIEFKEPEFFGLCDI